jgi:hypothetical protein
MQRKQQNVGLTMQALPLAKTWAADQLANNTQS